MKTLNIDDRLMTSICSHIAYKLGNNTNRSLTDLLYEYIDVVKSETIGNINFNNLVLDPYWGATVIINSMKNDYLKWESFIKFQEKNRNNRIKLEEYIKNNL